MYEINFKKAHSVASLQTVEMKVLKYANESERPQLIAEKFAEMHG